MPFQSPQRLEIKFESNAVQNMLNLLKASPFPAHAPLDAEPWKLGIDYKYLKDLKTRLETQWNSDTLERKIAQYPNYIVHYTNGTDELDLHYQYVKSPRENAIPLILLHGWPGSCYDFHKVIDSLANPSSADQPAFDVVVPSLPGFLWSTLPRRDGFTIRDTAIIFNELMTELLGYKTYAGQGGDWGSFIIRHMGHMFPATLKILHLNMYPSMSSDFDPTTLSETERSIVKRSAQFFKNGAGYESIQSTKPFTIGLAIASSPQAVLAYIGEKIYAWSDPSLVSQEDIINTVALYYLTGCFATSVCIYQQSAADLARLLDPKALQVESKIGYSAFPYEIVGAPICIIREFGNFVYTKEHDKGGHFPALDCPDEFVSDMREFFGVHWVKINWSSCL